MFVTAGYIVISLTGWLDLVTAKLILEIKVIYLQIVRLRTFHRLIAKKGLRQVGDITYRFKIPRPPLIIIVKNLQGLLKITEM